MPAVQEPRTASRIACVALIALLLGCGGSGRPGRADAAMPHSPEAGRDAGGRGGSAGSDGGMAPATDGAIAEDAAAGDDGSVMDGGEPSVPGYAPYPGLDEGGRARRIGERHFIAGQALLTAGDGTSWLLWRSYGDPSFADQEIALDQFDGDGRYVRSSALAALDPDGALVHTDGSLTAFRNRCGSMQADTCFHRDELAGELTAVTWPNESHSVTQHELNWDGDVVGTSVGEFDRGFLALAAADGRGLYAVTRARSYVVHRLDERYEPLWSRELLPAVVPPEVPPDAPIEEILRATDLALQFATTPVAIEGGVVVAAIANRGTLAALNATRGTELPLPADPRCADVVIVRVPEDGGEPDYWSVPTSDCESLPKLAVTSGYAVVASVVRIAKPPEPNDTHQYDIGLAILDLATGESRSRTIAFTEDDIVHALAACGDRVCLAGVTGARSVDTGSTVSYGDGFILPVSLAGDIGERWTLTSARHTEILFLVAAPNSVLFFASVNAPITHTADEDPWLGFNEALLGIVTGL